MLGTLCQVTGTRRWIRALDLPILTSWRPWRSATGQVRTRHPWSCGCKSQLRHMLFCLLSSILASCSPSSLDDALTLVAHWQKQLLI